MKIKFENLSKYLKQIKKLSLICPNCLREMPSLKHRREKGCKWCIQETSNSYCDGKH